MTAPVLLTVSGTIDPHLDDQIAAGERPRPDYLEMARHFPADLIDFDGARRRTGRLGRIIERLAGPKALLAWATFRQRRQYDAIVTDGEQIGLPYALLCRMAGRGGARHHMIVHVLSVPKKVRLLKAFRLAAMVDTYFVYASSQRDFIAGSLAVTPERIVLTPFAVDCDFFAPQELQGDAAPMVCTAGLEFRDYETLIDAVRGLDVKVVIAAGSRWSKRPDTARSAELPPNVEVCTLDYVALRDLYARARFVVMPLQEVDFQAGITTILEAMAMGKAVVCSRTRGQTDTVVDGVTGIYVDPGDSAGLRAGIGRLLADPDLATAMGLAARDWAVQHAEVEAYARGLGSRFQP